ncbi:MAG: ribosome silencing factor [Acidiferrobacterales bacterium]|nr:ribosome silencing factor [Acidiferrobacterales bacterium]
MSKQREKTNEAELMRDIAIAALEEAKGEDIKVIDVRQLTDVTDIMIVSTGTSDRHVKTLSSRVLEAMHEAGWQHVGVEGEEARDWILVDFVDIVVHVMREQARQRYDLESLWDKTFNELTGEGPAAEVLERAKPAS